MPGAPKTIELPAVATSVEAELDRPWQVTVYNDPVNLMSYVTMVFMRVFGYARAKAEEMMMAVHTKGKCIVWTGERERAELYLEQLHAYQLNAAISEAS
jgi:ATP-dependent Clp protease adaptor protein ClpS